jgi:hypothetical protein
MRATVFLSYAHDDSEAAVAVTHLLQTQGIDCWVDQKGIPLGSRYDREIEQAIRRSAAVLWLVSSRSIDSDYVKFEVTTAYHQHKPILPIRIEPIDLSHLPAPLNLKLGNVQAWDYFATPTPNFGAELADGLRGLVSRDRRRFVGRVAAVATTLGVIGVLGAWRLVTSGGRQLAIPPAHAIPASLASLPFGEVLRIVYSESPPFPASGRPRVALRLAIEARRRGEQAFSVLQDGEALASRSDDYRIIAQALSRGYLYLFQADAMGKVDWLFPRNETSGVSGGSNPLAQRQVIRVPMSDPEGSLYLDSTVGVEHVYAIFSATRWTRLEQALVRPIAEEEPAPTALATRGIIDAPNELGLRGVGGMRTDAPGGGARPAPIGDRCQGDGYFLVLERWFRHVTPG